jgi:hypothetical protein
MVIIRCFARENSSGWVTLLERTGGPWFWAVEGGRTLGKSTKSCGVPVICERKGRVARGGCFEKAKGKSRISIDGW